MTLKQIASLGKELIKFITLLWTAYAATPVSPGSASMSKDCSRACNAKTWKPSPWNLARRHALYSVSWNQSSGMSRV